MLPVVEGHHVWKMKQKTDHLPSDFTSTPKKSRNSNNIPNPVFWIIHSWSVVMQTKAGAEHEWLYDGDEAKTGYVELGLWAIVAWDRVGSVHIR